MIAAGETPRSAAEGLQRGRGWLVALAASILFAAMVAIPTDLVDTPLFGREIPPTWWSWPALAVSSVLAGALIATFVPASAGAPPCADRSARRGGYAGGLLTLFAVGCPVCNKLVLVALGSAGAIAWFEPVQPVLQLVAIVLLAWALGRRLRAGRACSTSTGGVDG